jgi:hypothetical protein
MFSGVIFEPMRCSSVVDIPTHAVSSETQVAKLARKYMWRSLVNVTPIEVVNSRRPCGSRSSVNALIKIIFARAARRSANYFGFTQFCQSFSVALGSPLRRDEEQSNIGSGQTRDIDSRYRKSWPRHFDRDRSALFLPIEQYEHPQAGRAFIKGKQSFSLALSILGGHIGKIPE